MDDGDCCVAALCSSSFHENLSLFSSPSKEQSLHLLLFTRISQARCYGQHCNSFPSGQNKNFQFGISENNDLFQTKKKIIQSGFQWKKNLLSSKYEFVKGLLRPKLKFKRNLIDTKLSFKRNIFNAKRRFIQPLFNKKVNILTSLLQHKIRFLRNIFG